MTTEVISYSVLYYKRTQKVHKSKGVSKLDGLLTIHPSTAKVVLRPEAVTEDESSSDEEQDTKKRSWKKNKSKTSTSPVASATLREIAERAQEDALHEDDVVIVGGYQVCILSRLLDANAIKNSKSPSLSTVQPKQRPSKPVPPRRPLLGTSRLIRTASSTTHSKQTRGGPAKSSLPLKRKPPAQPKLQQRPQHPVVRRAPPIQPTQGAGSNSKRGQPLLPRKRPLTSLGTTAARSISRSRPHPRLQQQPRHAVSATILPHMDLPGSIRTALRPHQITGVDFVHRALQTPSSTTTTATGNTRGCILADEMGLGKTLMTISVVAALHRSHRDKHFLIVCPSSLVGNWAQEFDKWLGKASQPKRVVIRKGGEEGLQQIRSFATQSGQSRTGQVLIVSYDLLRMHGAALLAGKTKSHQEAALIVADEAHKLKNQKGSLTLTALQSIPSQARLCLTATPIQNNLLEFFALADFACPGILGSVADFRRDYERPIAAANRKGASPAAVRKGQIQSQALAAITDTFVLRRLQKDVLKTVLPPRTEALLFCQASAAQRTMYQRLAQNGRDALSTLGELRKVCAHPSQVAAGSAQKVNSSSTAAAAASVEESGKLQVLQELLQSIRKIAPADKVVVVSSFTSTLSLIETSVLKPNGMKSLRLDGTVESANRQNLVDVFNRDKETFCFLLSSKAGGCGLNLVGANRLILFDPDWNPAHDTQAMGRVYRTGQTKPCTIYRLFTSGTCEEVIYQRQTQKGGLAALTVDSASSGSAYGKFTKEEIADCFTLKDENCKCDTQRKVSSWPDKYDISECSDEPLLQTAKLLPNILSYVHLVNDEAEHDNASVEADEEEQDLRATTSGEMDEEDESSSSEEEFD